MASFAAILAIGKPVALDASAEERETRGFISMTIMRPVAGSIANWMLQPPVSTPTSRRMAMPTSRMCWYSRSVRVIEGATVTESPVWTPMGSTFSMEQTTTTLSLWSRMSSSSYSFQPSTDSSMRTSVVGDSARPFPAMRSTSSQVWAMPEPRPPMVKEGRMTTGRPRSLTVSRTSSMVWQTAERGTSPPTSSTTCLNCWRSSPRWMASMSAPMSSTPYFSRMPALWRPTAALRAVWPPRVARIASGFSLAMICSMTSVVIGST